MKAEQYKLPSRNTDIHVYSWMPDNPDNIKAVIQIVHGMAEYGERYADFASFLVKNGFAVFASDHRGHGKTAKNSNELGFFAEKNGWNLVIDDLKNISNHIKNQFPQKPFFIFGHSMGSLLTRNYIMDVPFELSGVILSGTAGKQYLLAKAGIFLTQILMLFNKKNSKSPTMNKLMFGTFNKQLKPIRTEFDWLSRDNAEVDKYIKDEYCGFLFSLKAYNDLLRGAIYVNKQQNINKTNTELPICLISGTKDPVGNNGKGVKQVYHSYQQAGLQNIELKLFDDCRHELVNETNKTEIYNFVLQWCQLLMS